MPDPSPVVSVSSSASPMPLLASEEVIFKTRPNFIITLFFILVLFGAGALLFWFLLRLGVLAIVPLISSAVFEIIFAGVFLFVGLVIFLSWLNTEYILTNERVEWHFGIIGEGTISITLDKIQNIYLIISILGRIFNFGNIKIEPAGLTTSINFGGIANPVSRKEQIENAVS